MGLRIAPLLLAFSVAALLQFSAGKAQFDLGIDFCRDLNLDLKIGTNVSRIGVILFSDAETENDGRTGYFYQRVPDREGVFIVCTKNATEAQSAPTFDRPIRWCGSLMAAVRSVDKRPIFLVSLNYPYIGLRPGNATADCEIPIKSPPSLCNPFLPAVDSPEIDAWLLQAMDVVKNYS